MLMNILAVGDIVGEPGLKHLERHLRPLQKLKNIAFTVVNGENASGVGLTPDQAWPSSGVSSSSSRSLS